MIAAKLIGGPAAGLTLEPGHGAFTSSGLVAWVQVSAGDAKYTRFDADEPTMVFECIDDSGLAQIVENYGDPEANTGAGGSPSLL